MEISWTAAGSTGVLAPDRVGTTDDVTELHDALLAAFADADAVLCDLSATATPVDPAELAGALAGAASRVADWPSAVLTVVAPQDELREQLLVQPRPASLVVVATRSAVPAPVASTDVHGRRQLLEPVLRAPALAREFLRRTLDGWPADGYRDEALVVVDELVANAVLHAGTEIELRLVLQPDRLGLAVADRSPGRPSPGRPAEGAESGRGLLLVDAMTRSWHVLPRRGGGKVIRAVLVSGGTGAAAGGPGGTGQIALADGTRPVPSN